MGKKILITGSTDGIGLVTAKRLVSEGHSVIIHGRNEVKIQAVKKALYEIDGQADIDAFVADLSTIKAVRKLAEAVLKAHDHIDVLINNAGIYVATNAITKDNLELRFAVNTYAPYLLTNLLASAMDENGRIINLSSAAQASVDLYALENRVELSDGEAYAQSKLALTMWSFQLGEPSKRKTNTPSIIAVNPKSLLGSKMVKEAYGTKGHDINIGADILCRASLSEEFNNASGKYFDNDYGQFSNPHPDALDEGKRQKVLDVLDRVIDKII